MKRDEDSQSEVIPFFRLFVILSMTTCGFFSLVILFVTVFSSMIIGIEWITIR